MPIVFRVLAGEGLYISDWTGSVDDAVAVAAYAEFLRGSDYEPGLNEFGDLRGCDLRGLTAAGLTRIAELTATAIGDTAMKTAVVTDRDLTYGLARMYEMLAEESPESLGIFREADAAAKWLGVPVDVLERTEFA